MSLFQLLCVGLLIRASTATPCTAECAKEFDRCMEPNSNGQQRSHAACRGYLDQGSGPLALVCTKGCTDTTSMASYLPSPPPAPRQLLCDATDELTSGTYYLTQKGVDSNRLIEVHVPDSDGPFPLLFAFHGSGGSGSGYPFSEFKNAASTKAYSVIRDSHVLVSPHGLNKGWNSATCTDPDDVEFVHMMIDALDRCSNVKGHIVQLFGMSNGAALVNRILIESQDPRIVRGVTDVSQLNDVQHHDGSFYQCGSSSAYNSAVSKLYPREVLALQGGNDKVIVAAGGASLGGKLTMLSDSNSVYEYALAYGHTGSKLASKDFTTYKLDGPYLGGKVSSYTVYNAGHRVLGTSSAVDSVTTNFLKRSLDSSLNPPAPSAPSAPSSKTTAYLSLPSAPFHLACAYDVAPDKTGLSADSGCAIQWGPAPPGSPPASTPSSATSRRRAAADNVGIYLPASGYYNPYEAADYVALPVDAEGSAPVEAEGSAPVEAEGSAPAEAVEAVGYPASETGQIESASV